MDIEEDPQRLDRSMMLVGAQLLPYRYQHVELYIFLDPSWTDLLVAAFSLTRIV